MSDNEKGFAFPFRIDPHSGGVMWKSGKDKIRQNIRLILGSRIGERPMIRSFGTRIPSLVHDPNNDVLGDLIQKEAQAVLLQWENRVMVTATRIRRKEHEVSLNLVYLFSDGSGMEEMDVPLE